MRGGGSRNNLLPRRGPLAIPQLRGIHKYLYYLRRHKWDLWGATFYELSRANDGDDDRGAVLRRLSELRYTHWVCSHKRAPRPLVSLCRDGRKYDRACLAGLAHRSCGGGV